MIKNGRESVTEYEVIKRIGKITFLKVKLITGRKHQIRTHLSYIGNPILNDKLYGGKQSTNFPVNSIALHAYNLQFVYSKKNYEFKCELPNYLKKLNY